MDKLSVRRITVLLGLLGIAGCAGDRPTNLGVRNGILAACPSSPNCVSSQAVDNRHRIAPITFNDEPDRAFARLRQVLAARNDTTVISEQPGYLRVELRTMLFVDDGEFYLDRERRVIEVRSASRLGYSDLGKNRRRLEEIRSKLVSAEVKP